MMPDNDNHGPEPTHTIDEEGFKAVYLVRERRDQMHPREFVGIFAADDLGELIDLVDECCDAECCEYRVMPSGGIMAPSRSNVVPWSADEADKPDFEPMMGAVPSEGWASFFADANDDRLWARLMEI